MQKAFLTSLSELLENAGIEVTYAWEVIDIAAKQFRPITNRAEAEDMLVQRTLANNEKRAAQALAAIGQSHGAVRSSQRYAESVRHSHRSNA